MQNHGLLLHSLLRWRTLGVGLGLLTASCGGVTTIELDSVGDSGDSGDGSDESGGETPAASLCSDLGARATETLTTTCESCHSGSTAPAGFGNVNDISRLVQSGRLVPGDAESSSIYTRVQNGQMPPAGIEPRPSDEQVADLAAWINQCVAEQICTHEEFISTDQILDMMRTDISDTNVIPSDERIFYRYFTLTQLYNAGICGEDLDHYRWALSKAVNSLSTGTRVVPPVAIDPLATIYRIDLRDYGWDAALWDAIAAQNPQAIEYLRDDATDLKDFTDTAIPFFAGDWFVSAASRPPLYHEILKIPENRASLEAQFEIDVEANIEFDEVARSGFRNSGVSVNNRLIERHEFPGASNRSYWLSYDFANNAGTGNIFSFPLDFEAAGNEIIFSLPNGLHGYMITEVTGERIDEAPDSIVTDPSQPNQNVVNGLSCMGCHAQGIIPRDDQLREDVLSNFEFDDETKEKVTKLHPEQDELDALQQGDSDLFLNAVAQTGTPTNLTWEPINRVFQEFDADVDLRRAAAELGISPVEMSNQIGRLGPDLQALISGSIKREVFILNFANSVCDLNIGRTSACPELDSDR